MSRAETKDRSLDEDSGWLSDLDDDADPGAQILFDEPVVLDTTESANKRAARARRMIERYQERRALQELTFDDLADGIKRARVAKRRSPQRL